LYWPESFKVSKEAQDFVGLMINPNPSTRYTAEQLLKQPWLQYSEFLSTKESSGAIN